MDYYKKKMLNCSYCKRQMYVIDLMRHLRYEHNKLIRHVYTFNRINDLIDVLIRESFLRRTFYQEEDTIQLHNRIGNTLLSYFTCKKYDCKMSAFVYRKYKNNFLLFYVARHSNDHNPNNNVPCTSVKMEEIFLNIGPYNNLRVLTKEDASSIRRNVLQFIKNNLFDNDRMCPIVFYKPQYEPLILGIRTALIDGIEDLFLLGIQRYDVLNKIDNCNKDVHSYVMDISRRSNAYGHLLITLQILTRDGRNLPLFYVIVSKLNVPIFAYLCEYFKPYVKSNLILSNCDTQLFNLLRENFADKFVFCKYDLSQKIWKKLLETERDVNNVNEIFNSIIGDVIFNRRVDDFANFNNSFVTKWERISPNFIKFYKDYYVDIFNYLHQDKIIKSPINSNRYALLIVDKLISRHNWIPLKRMNDLITMLMACGNDDNEESLIRLRNFYDGEEIINHIKSKTIPNSAVRCVNNQIYELKEEITYCDTSNSSYSLTRVIFKKTKNKNNIRCEHDDDYCLMKCEEDGCFDLCSHLYVCNCWDTSALCYHIHKIHSIINNGTL